MKKIGILLAKIILFLLPITSLSAREPTELDFTLQKHGIVDKNFRVINIEAFDAELRKATNQINSYTPVKIDHATTLETAMFTRFGFYATYTIVVKRTDLQYIGELGELFQSNLCNDAFFNSKTIQQLNIPFAVVVFNQEGVKVIDKKMYSNQCGK